MRLDRAGTRLAAGVVAAVAGYSSWQHIVAVARAAGEHASVAAVMPLSIDGLIVVSTLAMLEDKRAGKYPRLSARVGLAFGIACTLAFNLASAEPSWDARGVAAVPAVVFLVAVEILSRTGKPRDADMVPVPVERRAKTEPETVGTSPVLPTSFAPSVPAQRRPSRQERKRSTAEETATRIREAAASLPADATPEQIAAKARTSERTVRRYLPAAVPVPDDASTLLPDPDPTTGGRVPALSVT